MKLENAENPQEILFGDRTRKMALSYSTGIEFRIHVEVKSFTSALKPLQTPINIFFFHRCGKLRKECYTILPFLGLFYLLASPIGLTGSRDQISRILQKRPRGFSKALQRKSCPNRFCLEAQRSHLKRMSSDYSGSDDVLKLYLDQAAKKCKFERNK